jgi:hypothetical protein
LAPGSGVWTSNSVVHAQPTPKTRPDQANQTRSGHTRECPALKIVRMGPRLSSKRWGSMDSAPWKRLECREAPSGAPSPPGTQRTQRWAGGPTSNEPLIARLRAASIPGEGPRQVGLLAQPRSSDPTSWTRLFIWYTKWLRFPVYLSLRFHRVIKRGPDPWVHTVLISQVPLLGSPCQSAPSSQFRTVITASRAPTLGATSLRTPTSGGGNEDIHPRLHREDNHGRSASCLELG